MPVVSVLEKLFSSLSFTQHSGWHRKFDDTNDMRQVRNLLMNLTTEDQEDQLLTETVLNVFSFQETKWNVVLRVADNVLHEFDPTIHEAMSIELSVQTTSQFEQLRDNA